MLRPLSNNLPDFIQKLQTLPVSQLRKLDGILSDIANHIYEIGEYISEVLEQVSGLNEKQKEQLLIEMIVVEKQLQTMGKLLYGMEYDSHYMDRAQHTLDFVTKGLKGLIEELKKV